MKKMMIILLMLALPSAVWGQQPVKQQKPAGELASDQMEAVRRIGQAVLGAKQSYIPPSALSATRAELDALKGSIEKTQSVVNDGSSPGTFSSKITPATPQENAGKDQQTRDAKDKQEIDFRLQAIITRHKELDTHAAGNANGIERELEQGASEKLLELEHELAEAQAAPSTERWERLGALAEKLTPKSLLSVSKAVEPPPTISTIVEHRQ